MTEDLIKEAGALGVYASHYLNLNDRDRAIHRPARQTIPILNTPTSPSPSPSIRRKGNPQSLDTSRLLRGQMSRSTMLIDAMNSPLSLNGSLREDDELTAISAFPISDPVLEAADRSELPAPSSFAILMKLIETLAGKDKLGKVVQYGLRILLFYSKRSTSFLQRTHAEGLKFPTGDYKGIAGVIMGLIQRPEFVALFLLKDFETRAAGVVSGLSMYRQMLRCGKTPFRLVNLAYKLSATASVFANKGVEKGILNVRDKWFTPTTLSDLLSVYYSIFDESLLLFKLGVFGDPRFRRFAVKHEALAWYYNIILGLYKSLSKLSTLKESQNQIKINQQVRQRAKALMRNSVNASSSPRSAVTSSYYNYQSPTLRAVSPSPSVRRGLLSSAASTAAQEEIDELGKQIKNEQIEILKLLCDFVFDTITVFELKVYEPVHLSFGLGAGALAMSKVWMQVKEDLQDS
ncbi:unnamed protein product [Kuraishia capsulata CBS 1993]|uniref:Uncharacterized protein n=1 Tax=Kuraishia capsulata CBS 1993 TaxID=1382522 RepID=W6MSG6_9ASCO|nr:uncharacterized protein KUCA_T00005647001 [Kuraishia capsulata CBS 1993]CDK29654.1 unnamed protein product [Kuraishia capsulata CBS 1993]